MNNEKPMVVEPLSVHIASMPPEELASLFNCTTANAQRFINLLQQLPLSDFLYEFDASY